MVTTYRRSNTKFQEVGTTRLISVPTGTATQIQISSGYYAMIAANVGAATLAYGDSTVEASSGALLFYSMAEMFNPVQGDFSIYFAADSVAGTVAINELR